MIAIVNVGPHDDPNPLGERNYELRINSDVIATFKHKRGDGLAKCLMLAAAAEERRKWEFAAKIVARQSLPNDEPMRGATGTNLKLRSFWPSNAAACSLPLLEKHEHR